MASRNMLFRAMYRVGFTPWDGHPLAKSLHDLVEGNGSPALPAATALDIGCGTGDASIYLAQHGWQVTGVDFVPRALAKARAKAQARQASVNFVQADVRVSKILAGLTSRCSIPRWWAWSRASATAVTIASTWPAGETAGNRSAMSCAALLPST